MYAGTSITTGLSPPSADGLAHASVASEPTVHKGLPLGGSKRRPRSDDEEEDEEDGRYEEEDGGGGGGGGGRGVPPRKAAKGSDGGPKRGDWTAALTDAYSMVAISTFQKWETLLADTNGVSAAVVQIHVNGPFFYDLLP